ncbi:hypothetical protein niasHT_039490 [Heterodera trifolii]|uniref:Uncharacterized protein n=1 Tax=Heterodera trifolii TaxID=157864 RepID=A0ABD2IG78_9BILA
MVVKCSLLPSIFAVLLLFLISALLEHGHGPDKVNEFRANLSAPTATDLKCTCHFGAKDKDMDNEQFVSGSKSTSSSHGVKVPLTASGLFIGGILPLFGGAILGWLNP